LAGIPVWRKVKGDWDARTALDTAKFDQSYFEGAVLGYCSRKPFGPNHPQQSALALALARKLCGGAHAALLTAACRDCGRLFCNRMGKSENARLLARMMMLG
jgi:hypothetical protein